MVPATLSKLRYKMDVNTLRKQSENGESTLDMNEIGRVHISLHRPVAFDAYSRNAPTGAFIVIDRVSNATVAAGMIVDRPAASERTAQSAPASRNIRPEPSLVPVEERQAVARQSAVTLWMTGFSGSGKSTVAQALEKRLIASGHLAYILDGDNLRHGLNRDLGFSSADRAENIRRVAEVSRLFNQAGVIVLTSFISPYRKDRELARDIIGQKQFLEIHVNTPLEICESRDPKGLYKKARTGEIGQFTGISDPYEAPEAPALVLPAHEMEVEEAVNRLYALLLEHECFTD